MRSSSAGQPADDEEVSRSLHTLKHCSARPAVLGILRPEPPSRRGQLQRDDQQAKHWAAEAGFTKGTLTGVLKTLEKRGLARRARRGRQACLDQPGAQGSARTRSSNSPPCSARSSGPSESV